MIARQSVNCGFPATRVSSSKSAAQSTASILLAIILKLEACIRLQVYLSSMTAVSSFWPLDKYFYPAIFKYEFRRRKEMTFTSSRFSRTPLCLPVRYMPEGMRLSGNSQNHFGIFRETCQVYFLTSPERCCWS